MERIPIMKGKTNSKKILLPRVTRGDRTIAGGSPRQSLVACLVVSASAFALAAGLARPVEAKPAWDYTANTDAAFTFTDNVLLTSQDQDADFITSLRGGVQAISETRGGSVNFSYQISFDFYVDTDELNGIRHNLLTQNTFVLVEDTLFFDVNASIGQRAASRSLQSPATSRTSGSNRTMVLTGSISPYVDTTFTDRIGVTARADYSVTEFRKTDVGAAARQPDGDSRWGGSFGVRSLDNDQRLLWSVSGDASRDDDNLEQRHADLLLRLSVGRDTKLIGRGGYDQTSGRQNGTDIDDAFWRVGFETEPIRDSYIRLEAGERFGEPSYEALVRYDVAQVLRITARFDHELRTDQNRFVNFLNAYQPVPVDALAGQIVLEDPFSPYYGLDIEGDIVDALTISETARLTLSGAIGRTSYSLSGFYRTREFEEIDGVGGPFEEEIIGATVNINRSFGRRIQAGFNAQYTDEESDLPTLGVGSQAIDLANEIDSINGTIFVSYAVSPTAQAMVGFTHSEREDQTGLTVEENVLMFTVTKTW